jgi:hypothetical protein
MKSTHRFFVIATALAFSVSLAGGQGPDPSVLVRKIANWPAPATWSPDSVAGGLSTMNAVTSPLPFIGLAPCRIADTRTTTMPNFPAGYGPPAPTAGVPRDFTLTGQCGIPSSAAAVSLNVTVTNTQGPGHIVIFPQGAVQPDVSTLNYVAGQTIANAAVVSLGTDGGITVIAAVSGTDLIIDTNGYYAGGIGESNTFLGAHAGNFTMLGVLNTGIGAFALQSNTEGDANTATGVYALLSNTTGQANTATGVQALYSNTTGEGNTATGVSALLSNTNGVHNTGVGHGALGNNTAGESNTAIGSVALANNTTGSGNIAVGRLAGVFLTTGNNNIDIGNEGVAGESNTIRIGAAGPQTATFIAGITGTAVTGVPVLVSGSGQLGVASSSRHVKEDIREIAEESDGLMKLRPVAFRYQAQIDPKGLAQYGLIAEEVAQVYPDLVVYDRDGRPETVRYQLVNALLLSEVQKQHRNAEAHEKTIEQQKSEIEALKARLGKLEGRRLADSRP